MAMIGMFKYDSTPIAAALWKNLGGNFHDLSQAICEFCDDSISNFNGNLTDSTLNRVVRIQVTPMNGMVDITVEDGGTGIQDLNNALRLAGQARKETPLNEHGFGLKHALAYVEDKGSYWEISTRTQEDAELNRYRKVHTPYSFSGEGEYHDGWIGSLGRTGTVIHFTCPMDIFNTLNPDTNKELTFDEQLAILKEHLRYVYADILQSGKARIEFISAKNGHPDWEVLQALMPQWDSSTRVVIPQQDYDLGTGAVKISCEYGCIKPSVENHNYYLGNMETSGVEVRINGRVVERGLMKAIWGRKVHNAENAFLVRVNLETNGFDVLPGTSNEKNGFRKGDRRLRKLFKWIRANVQIPNSCRESRECQLFRLLAEKKKKEPGMTRVSLEEGTFLTIGLHMRIDLFTCQNNKVTIYEGKVKKTKAIDVYQLKMYWDGCIEDGVPAEEGVLIGGSHSAEALTLIQYVNRMTGPDGRRYNFRTTTWKDEGIA